MHQTTKNIDENNYNAVAIIQILTHLMDIFLPPPDHFKSVIQAPRNDNVLKCYWSDNILCVTLFYLHNHLQINSHQNFWTEVHLGKYLKYYFAISCRWLTLHYTQWKIVQIISDVETCLLIFKFITNFSKSTNLAMCFFKQADWCNVH